MAEATTKRLTDAGLTKGVARTKVGFLKGAVMCESDLSDKAIEGLQARGFTHFENECAGLLAAEEVYTFTRVPDLETRLKEHVAAFFG